MTRTKEQLLIENKELQLRLAETEEALAAIRGGEVDAIMVPGRDGEQVYSISSAETPYRTFIEEMNEGAVTLTEEGLVIYCNQRFAELVNEPIERVIGSYLKRFIVPNDRSKFDKLLVHKKQNINNVLTVALVNSLYLKLSFHLLPAYLQGDNCILVATDVTEIKREEKKLLKLSHLLEQKLEIIQQLRMQLIEKKIDSDIEIKKLKSSNKKLIQKIARHMQVEADLKLRLKQKKKTL
ncbi:MAG: PAS domain-containing protein [Bacteroidales bacterium]|nr:PAS domain-containing protein [Bacteroidales bacterium]MDT8373526.1 PAS domain-containing protein [Bacteroidales bacterium]